MSLPIAILAGGLATRLRPLTAHVPKVLLEVAGKPFAVHQIELLRQQGFTEIVFCVGYLGEQVQLTLGDGYQWGVNLHYAFDGPAPLGTGGALRRALAQLGEAFLVMYGDTYLPCDLTAVERAFLASGTLGLMTVLQNEDLWDRSNVLFQDGRIVRYDKQQHFPGMRHIDYGLGGFRARALDAYQDGLFIDLATIYQNLLARDQLAGFEVTQRFYEIGSYIGLQETQQYLIKKRTNNGLRSTASC